MKVYVRQDDGSSAAGGRRLQRFRTLRVQGVWGFGFRLGSRR